jgi:hypothetical protein
VAERLKAAVLKTAVRASVPWVRIPPHPPLPNRIAKLHSRVRGVRRKFACPSLPKRTPTLVFGTVVISSTIRRHGVRERCVLHPQGCPLGAGPPRRPAGSAPLTTSSECGDGGRRCVYGASGDQNQKGKSPYHPRTGRVHQRPIPSTLIGTDPLLLTGIDPQTCFLPRVSRLNTGVVVID